MNIQNPEMGYLAVGVITTAVVIQNGLLAPETLAGAGVAYAIAWMFYDPVWKSGTLLDVIGDKYPRIGKVVGGDSR